MISTSDFSEKTNEIFNSVMLKKTPIIDLIDRLFDADFEKKEILKFIKLHFKGSQSFAKNRLKELTELN